MQIFTKQANRWAERVCADDECTAFRAALATTEVRRIAAHDSYLINLGVPRPRPARAVAGVIHRGASGAARRWDSTTSCRTPATTWMTGRADSPGTSTRSRLALEQAPGRVKVLMETTAGAGTGLGATFEEIAALVEGVPRGRFAIAWASASTPATSSRPATIWCGDYDGVWTRFGDVVGFERLHMMHLNDSKFGLGTRRDRHELIGEGHLGEGVFRRLMTDRAISAVVQGHRNAQRGRRHRDRRRECSRGCECTLRSVSPS